MYCMKVCFFFSGNRGKDDEYTEMNQQQLQFAKMSKEFYEKEEDEDDDTTFEMFLKYCPDALSHLFDKCIMKPVEEQVICGICIYIIMYLGTCKMYLFTLSDSR